MEDLRKLSFFEMQSRIETAEANIKTLLAELRAAQDSLANLEAKKEAKSPPLFEVGKCYRNRRGHVVGPLLSNGGGEYPFSCGHRTYTARGTVFLILGATDDDLLPGPVEPVPTWTPPFSLPDGGYRFSCKSLYTPSGGMCLGGQDAAITLFKDFTDPPRDGLWQVKDGKATYLGEA